MAIYYVTVFSTDKRVDDEWVIARCTDIEKAKKRARDEAYTIARDKQNYKVEIREYEAGDIDNEECTNFDYNLIEF